MLPGVATLRVQNQVIYEFGTAADGYFDDSIVVSILSKRTTVAANGFVDYDAIITGGSGKFLGATGRMTVSSAAFQDGSLIATSGDIVFEAWVPKRLPMAKTKVPK